MSAAQSAALPDAEALLGQLARAVPALHVAVRGNGSDLPPLYPEESALLSPRAVEKRRAEFHAGRIAARDVLTALGVRDFPLLKHANRAPVWPEAVQGSLSHTDKLACAIAWRSNQPVGVDLEHNAPLSSEIACAVSDADERRAFAGQVSPARIVFSAKESVYKSISLQIGRVVDFSEVAIEPAADTIFHARAKSDLSGWVRAGQIVAKGQVLCSDQHILTYAQSAL